MKIKKDSKFLKTNDCIASAFCSKAILQGQVENELDHFSRFTIFSTRLHVTAAAVHQEEVLNMYFLWVRASVVTVAGLDKVMQAGIAGKSLSI